MRTFHVGEKALVFWEVGNESLDSSSHLYTSKSAHADSRGPLWSIIATPMVQRWVTDHRILAHEHDTLDFALPSQTLSDLVHLL